MDLELIIKLLNRSNFEITFNYDNQKEKVLNNKDLAKILNETLLLREENKKLKKVNKSILELIKKQVDMFYEEGRKVGEEHRIVVNDDVLTKMRLVLEKELKKFSD